MILIVISALLMIASFIGLSYSLKTKKAVFGGISLLLTIITTTVSVTDLSFLLSRGCEASALQKKRDFYAEWVAHISSDMSFDIVSETINTAKDINKDIEMNRRNADNIFYGSFFNPWIAEIELIDIPDLHLANFDTE